jgi:hypothetical protein
MIDTILLCTDKHYVNVDIFNLYLDFTYEIFNFMCPYRSKHMTNTWSYSEISCDALLLIHHFAYTNIMYLENDCISIVERLCSINHSCHYSRRVLSTQSKILISISIDQDVASVCSLITWVQSIYYRAWEWAILRVHFFSHSRQSLARKPEMWDCEVYSLPFGWYFIRFVLFILFKREHHRMNFKRIYSDTKIWTHNNHSLRERRK